MWLGPKMSQKRPARNMARLRTHSAHQINKKKTNIHMGNGEVVGNTKHCVVLAATHTNACVLTFKEQQNYLDTAA